MNLPKAETQGQKTIVIVLIAITLIAIVWAFSIYLPPAIDWRDVFWPSGRAVLQGRSPFSIQGFYYAPWAAIPIALLSIFPYTISQALLVIFSLIALGYTAHKLGAKPLAIVFLLLSPPVLHLLLNGNIDALAVLGFAFPAQIGLFFIAIKPQVGIAVGIFWLVEAWRDGGLGNVIRVFWPFTLALLLSFAIFGLWPLDFKQPLSFWWNASLWPQSIPVGLALLVAAIRKRHIEYAMAASPTLSPYVLFHSWVGAILAVVASLPELIAVVIGLWILVAIQGAAIY
jgi:hypothetical protein